MSRQFYLKKFGRFSEKPYLCTAFRKRRGVAQLVAHLVWDQVVARSSRVTPTKKQRKSLQVQKKVVPLQRKNKMVPWMSGLVSGLQNQPRRFESARHLQKKKVFTFFFCFISVVVSSSSLHRQFAPKRTEMRSNRIKQRILIIM